MKFKLPHVLHALLRDLAVDDSNPLVDRFTAIFIPAYVRCPTLLDRSSSKAVVRARPTSLGTLSRGSPAVARNMAFAFSKVS